MPRIKNIIPDKLQAGEKIKVYKFLKAYISQGTVIMSENIYDSATNWAILYDRNHKIIGFSAQKQFDLKYFTVIQIMATFLGEGVRGRKLASFLMQDHLFVRHFFHNPLKPIYWCSRTRIPAALAAAMKHKDVIPHVFTPEKNGAYAPVAEFIAKRVYGNHISFDPKTFKMVDSYDCSSKFTNLLVTLKDKEKKLTRFFQDHINYTKNEAIFFMSKLSFRFLFKYFILSGLGRLSLLGKP